MFIEENALFSEDRKYRYFLERCWDPNLPKVMFICLNPSTADEYKPDPTLRRCISFAETLGFGTLYMTNLYAFVDTNQDEIWNSLHDPIGFENDAAILKTAKLVDKIIVGWGNNADPDRAKEVVKKLFQQGKTLFCLKHNKTGAPSHPLYLRRDSLPVPYLGIKVA